MNRSEELTFNRLEEVADSNDARVFPKIRVADVLPINPSGLGSELVRFGLMAHFDFVVADSKCEPLFAVEFDGPLHLSSEKQRVRDLKKNAICEELKFPLLRVNSRYINEKYRGLDLLSFFTRIWFASDAWSKAQAKGLVPDDEPFFPSFVMSEGQSATRFPYWLSLDVQLHLQALRKSGRILQDVTSDWIGVDAEDTHRCLAWLQVSDNSYIVARTGMRRQIFPLDVSDVLSQLSAFDIRRMLDGYLANKSNGHTGEYLRAELSRHKSNFDFRSGSGFIGTM